MKKFALAVVITLLLSFNAFGDTIILKNGKTIEAGAVWVEGNYVKCERFGGIVSYPQEDVKRIKKAKTRTTAVAVKKNKPVDQKPSQNNSSNYSDSLARKAYSLLVSDAFSYQIRQEAVEYLEQARQINPNDPWIFLAESTMILQDGYKIGSWYEASSFVPGTVNRAISVAAKAIEIDQNFCRGYSQLAWFYITKKDFGQATQMLETAYQLDPTSFYYWFYEGTMALVQDDLQNAEMLFDKALQYATEEHDRIMIESRRRDLAKRSGNTELQEKLLLKEIEKNPESAYSYGNYASFLMCNGRYAEAVEFWEKAISISPYPQALLKLEEAKRKL